MQTSQLRRATTADVANVRALARSAYAKWIPLIGREPMPMIADYDRALARSLAFDKIQLYTNAAFASNLSFYSRRGYQEYRRGAVVPGSVTVFMRKRIEVSG
jgi:hypothetical protein